MSRTVPSIVRDSTEETVTHLQAASAAATRGVKDAAAAYVEAARETASGVAGKVATATDEAATVSAEVARQAIDTTHRQLNSTSESVAEFVRRNPLTSVALAAGVGFILSAVSRR